MRLRYFDSTAHALLWPQLDPRFQPLAQGCLSAAEREAWVDTYFARLAAYPGPEPLLLVFHLSELRHSGGYYSLANWGQAWQQTGKVFCLLVTGGEPQLAQESLQRWQLPAQAFAAYSLSLQGLTAWSHLQQRSWQVFLAALAGEQQACWGLLNSQYYGPAGLKYLAKRLSQASAAELATDAVLQAAAQLFVYGLQLPNADDQTGSLAAELTALLGSNSSERESRLQALLLGGPAEQPGVVTLLTAAWQPA